jgi:hypothetical protein
LLRTIQNKNKNYSKSGKDKIVVDFCVSAALSSMTDEKARFSLGELHQKPLPPVNITLLSRIH